MNLKSLFQSWLGALLFLAGVLIALFLSAAVVWSESEALVYTSFNGEESLRVKCPLILSRAESGVVRTEVINLTEKDIKPIVSVEISQPKVPRRISQTIPLSAGESETLQWAVDSSDVIFERLILVNILQSRYSDNPSRSGSCGILLFSLFGLTGMRTFGLVIALSLAAMLSGGALWLYARWPLNKLSANLAQINGLLLGITTLAVLSAWLRWWGLTLFLDVLILLVVGVILTEFGLFSQKYRD